MGEEGIYSVRYIFLKLNAKVLVLCAPLPNRNYHHGVGIKLGRLMKEQYGPAMQVFEGIKKQLDPNGIMNPFKLGL